MSRLHQVAKVLELQLQHQCFQWIFRIDFLEDWLVWFPCSPRDPKESSPASQFKSINSLVLSLLYGPTVTSILTTGKTIAFTIQIFVGKVMSLLFNMLSRFVIDFFPRRKALLISWLSIFLGRTDLAQRCYNIRAHESVVVVQLLSHVWLFSTPWTAAYQASLSFTISYSFPRLISIESVMPSNHVERSHWKESTLEISWNVNKLWKRTISNANVSFLHLW